MPNRPSSSRSDARDGIADWMRQRSEAVAARMTPQARALGHEVFRAAIRTGTAIPLATPMAVALAGAQTLMRDRRQAPSPAARPQKAAVPLRRAAPPQRKPTTETDTRRPAQPLVSSRAAGARGNLVPDAYLAALAIESGSEWITTDRDFSRFPGLRWRHPLAEG